MRPPGLFLLFAQTIFGLYKNVYYQLKHYIILEFHTFFHIKYLKALLWEPLWKSRRRKNLNICIKNPINQLGPGNISTLGGMRLLKGID